MNKVSTNSPIFIDGLYVSYDPSTKALKRSFSPNEQVLFQKLLEKAQKSPKEAYKEALSWQEKTKAPELDNLLTYLHLQHKKIKKAETLIQDSYQRYPDYLFAKINYADQCLRKKKWDQIPLIFPFLTLQELFPNRTIFHVSEFRGFMTLMGHYHLHVGNRQKAELCYKNAVLADPLHPSVIILENALYPQTFLKKFLAKIKFSPKESTNIS